MRSFTILYVDDDQDDLFLLTEAFRHHATHLRLVHAGNGRDALQALNRMYTAGSLPCLVILDINMPVMDGKETLSQIRADQRFGHLPVVLFSTSSNPDDRRFATALGADFLTKPLSFSDMKSLVEEFVSRCQFESSVA